MRALYLPDLSIQNEYSLRGEALHHLVNVIRIRTEEELLLLNGKGLGVHTKVQSVSKKEMILSFSHSQTKERKSSIDLALGIPKKDALDLCLKQATELGLRRLYLIRADYSQGKVPERSRIESLLVSALEQANSYFLPEVHEINWRDIPFADYQVSLMLDSQTKEASNSSLQGGENCLLIVGPEGGFSPAELEWLRTRPEVQGLRLPTPILRTPTALATGVGVLLGRLLN